LCCLKLLIKRYNKRRSWCLGSLHGWRFDSLTRTICGATLQTFAEAISWRNDANRKRLSWTPSQLTCAFDGKSRRARIY